MELPADPPPASGTELEQLGKEQALGEAANLGCQGVETPNAVKTVVSRGPAKNPGKTATPGDRQSTAIPTAIQRSPVRPLTVATAGGSPTTIETCTGKTRKRAGKT
jgi:hypothetical protein